MATADTKERILDAAEALFARQGFAATALRSVIGEAGVNLAAVHYHFGSKEELIRAVFARRFDPINRERLALLDALERRAERVTITLEELLELLMLPVLRVAREEGERWSTASTLVGRVHSEPDISIRQIFYDQFDEVGERFVDALARALPELSREELFHRFHFSIAAMAASLVHPDEVRLLSKGRIDPTSDPESFLRRWVAFAAAGLRAPASDRPKRRKRDAAHDGEAADRGGDGTGTRTEPRSAASPRSTAHAGSREDGALGVGRTAPSGSARKGRGMR